MRLLLYIVAMCSALLVGCTTDEHTAALIRHAEDIAADYPALTTDDLEAIRAALNLE